MRGVLICLALLVFSEKSTAISCSSEGYSPVPNNRKVCLKEGVYWVRYQGEWHRWIADAGKKRIIGKPITVSDGDLTTFDAEVPPPGSIIPRDSLPINSLPARDSLLVAGTTRLTLRAPVILGPEGVKEFGSIKLIYRSKLEANNNVPLGAGTQFDVENLGIDPFLTTSLIVTDPTHGSLLTRLQYFLNGRSFASGVGMVVPGHGDETASVKDLLPYFFVECWPASPQWR